MSYGPTPNRVEVRPYFKSFGLASVLAVLSVLAAVLFFTASADAATGVQSFSLTASTATQGATPDLSLAATRAGTDADDLKLSNLKLPNGLNYTVAAAAKCSAADFVADNCPAASVVGAASATGKVQFYGYTLLSGAAPGTIYALSNTQLGTIYRPGAIPNFSVKTTITGSPASGISLASGDYPRTVSIFGLFNFDLTISGLDNTFNGKSAATKTGPVVITNPTTCGAATSALGFTGYDGSAGTKTSSFNVTGCGNPTGPTGQPTGPTGQPTGPTGQPTGPTGNPTGPTGQPTGPTGQPTGPTGQPTGPTGQPTGPTGPIDTTPPLITITAPGDNSTTTLASTTLAFTATDDSGAAPVCDKSTGSTVALALGLNTITVTCHDASNNSAAKSVKVTRNTRPTPVITVTAPTEGLITKNANVVVSFTALDADGVAVTNCSPASGSSVALAVGGNPISISCTDSQGAVGTKVVNVTRDTAGPTITGLPAEGSTVYTKGPGYAIPSFTATDNSPGTPTCSPAAGSAVTINPGANTVSVTCTDAPGNTTTRSWIVLLDTTPPVISITAPVDGLITGSASTPLAYTATDNDGQTPTCTPASGGSSALISGSNTISVTCTDKAGNSATKSVTVFRDTVAPVITISAPTEGQNVAGSSVQLDYTVSDNYDPAPTCSPATGSSQSLPIIGENTITVTCNDHYGNSASKSVKVNRGTNPAIVLTILTPTDGLNTQASSVGLHFTATGGTGAITCDKTDNSSQALNPGSNTITVTCHDSATPTNVTSTKSVTVFRDNVAPVVTGLPSGTQYTKGPNYTIPSYGATDNSGAAPSCTPAIGASVAVVAGSQSVTITCTDAAGNAGTGVITLFRDNTNPSITISAPTDGLITGSASTTLSFVATDNDGQTPTCTPATGSSVALISGTNTVGTTCTDKAGNSATKSVSVTRDTVAPSINITAPTDGSTVVGSSVLLTYTATDALDPSPTCTPASGTNQPLPIIGQNTITVNCADHYGNSSSKSVTVTRGSNPPINLAILAPTDGLNTQSTSVNLHYTATGGTGTITCDKTDNSSQALNPGANTITVNCHDAATPTNVTATQSVSVFRDNTPPVITGGLTGTFYTQASSYVIPSYSATDNAPASPTCSPAVGASVALNAGANTITITCSDVAGNTATKSWTEYRDNTAPPAISTFSPATGRIDLGASVVLTYTVPTDNSGSAVTCMPVSGTTIVLNPPLNPTTQVVNCTDAAGNTSPSTWTGTQADTNPQITSPPSITASGPPSATSSAPGSISFTLPVGATGAECRYNGGAWSDCATGASTIDASVKKATTDAATPFFTTANSGENTYEVRGKNVANVGPIAKRFIWIDDRAYTAKPQIGSSDYGAGKNPAAVSGRIDLQGYDDPKSLEASLPDGMAGSLSAVPVANRCTLTLAKAGNCPASSLVGQAVVSAESPTDGEVTATGSIYLVNAGTGADALNPRYAAGAVLVFKNIAGSVTPNLGDVVGMGGLELSDQARSQHLVVSADTTPGSNPASVAQTSQYGSQLFSGETDQQALPNQTSTGNRFHVKQVKLLTLFGTTGAHTTDGFGNALATPVTTSYSAPLIWNSHACVSTTQTARPNRQNFRGTAKGYNGSTFAAAVTAPYVPTDCASEIFTPTINYTLSSYAAGNSPTNAAAVTPVSLTANVNFPAGNQSSIKAMWITLPPYLGVLTENIGSDANQCDPTASVQVAPTGTGAWTTFNYTAAKCFPESRVGTMTLNSPLVPTPIVGQLYFLGGGAVPNIGVRFDSSTAGNIPGLDNLGLYGGTSTVDYEQTLIDGGAACTDPESAPLGYCQTSLQTSFSNIPDLPISSATVVIGDNTTRTDHTNGNAPMSQYVLKLANHASTTCQSSVDNDIITRMLPYSNNSTSTVSTTTFAAQRKLTTPVPITGCDF